MSRLFKRLNYYALALRRNSAENGVILTHAGELLIRCDRADIEIFLAALNACLSCGSRGCHRAVAGYNLYRDSLLGKVAEGRGSILTYAIEQH